MLPLQPFWFQPNNAWWWLTHLLGLIFPLIGIALLGIPLVVIDTTTALLSIAIFAGLGLIAITALSRAKYAPDHSVVLIGLSFLYGAFIAVGLSLLMGVGIGNLTTLFGTPMFSASFGGAIPEETFKLFCVLIILNLTRRWVYHPAQLMVIGMGVGLGFDIIENMSYGANSAMMDANTDLTTMLSVWGIRLLAGPLVHMVWTGISAWGLGQFIFNKKVSGIGWLFFSMAAHFIFNAQWPFDVILSKGLVDIAAFGVITVVYLISLSILVRIWFSTGDGYKKAKANYVAQVEDYQAKVRDAYASPGLSSPAIAPSFIHATQPQAPH